MQADPFYHSNSYQYVTNNPLNYIDPNGLKVQCRDVTGPLKNPLKKLKDKILRGGLEGRLPGILGSIWTLPNTILGLGVGLASLDLPNPEIDAGIPYLVVEPRGPITLL